MTDLDTRMQLGAAYRRDPLGTVDRFEGYQRLDGQNAHRVDGFLARHGRDEGLAVAMRQLIESEGFGSASPQIQASLLDAAAEHPDARTIGNLRRLAADDGFQSMGTQAADAEIARVVERRPPDAAALTGRAGMPAVERNGVGATEGLELVFSILHYAEGVAGLEIAEALAAAAGTAFAGAAFAGFGAALSIYGVAHQVENAHEEGRAMGAALQHGAGFVARLAEHAGHGESTPRTPEERRGAAEADRCWRGMRPSERVALSGEDAGRVFRALNDAVVRRAMGRD